MEKIEKPPAGGGLPLQRPPRPPTSSSRRSSRSWADLDEDDDYELDPNDSLWSHGESSDLDPSVFSGNDSSEALVFYGSSSDLPSSDASPSVRKQKVKKLRNAGLTKSSASGVSSSGDMAPGQSDEATSAQYHSLDEATSSASESTPRGEASKDELDVVELAEGIPSVGSMKHDEGTCRVCLFVNTRLGCNKGVACEFCHFQHKRSDGRPRACKGKRERYKKLVELKMGQTEGSEDNSNASDSGALQAASKVISLADSL